MKERLTGLWTYIEEKRNTVIHQYEHRNIGGQMEPIRQQALLTLANEYADIMDEINNILIQG